MSHAQSRESIGASIERLIARGYSVDIHYNRISGQYRIVVVHHCTDSEFCVRDGSLMTALDMAVSQTTSCGASS